MLGEKRKGRQMGREMMSRAAEGVLQNFKGAISAGERQLMEEMLRQSPPLIRGMNSQTRIDMLKQPKFRK